MLENPLACKAPGGRLRGAHSGKHADSCRVARTYRRLKDAPLVAVHKEISAKHDNDGPDEESSSLSIG